MSSVRGGAGLADKLAAALDAGAPPAGMGDLVRYVGGQDALKSALSGYSSRKAARAAGDEKAWTNANRRIEHSIERGSKSTSLTSEQRGRVARAGTRVRYSRFVARGARVSVDATVTPYPGSSDQRRRELPAGGPGVFFTTDDLLPVLELVDDGQPAAAARLLWETFTDQRTRHYQVPGMELVRVHELRIEPEW